MLSHAKEHESLTGKLLLSSALVAVTVGYGWWQHNAMSQQQAAAIAAMQMPAAPAQAQPQTQPMAAAPQEASSTPGSPNGNVTSPAPSQSTLPAPDSSTAAASPAPKATQLAMAAPLSSPSSSSANSPNAGTTPVAPQQNVLLPSTPPPPMAAPTLTGMDAIRAFLPTEGISPPLPPVSGTPDPGANPPIPAGTHLEDGDYESDKVTFEWGDLRARIVVASGKITTVQIMSYPDHRSQSLYLIQLADPILTSEVIKSQQAKVNTVSSATNSSIAFQDAIAGAIIKATR
jgi:uncharacterized protein with FMN-binding domain